MLGNTVAWPSQDYNPEAFLKLTFEIVVLLWFCKACTSLGLKHWFGHRIGVHRLALACLTRVPRLPLQKQSPYCPRVYTIARKPNLPQEGLRRESSRQGLVWQCWMFLMFPRGSSLVPSIEHFATAIWYLLPVWTPLPADPVGHLFESYLLHGNSHPVDPAGHPRLWISTVCDSMGTLGGLPHWGHGQNTNGVPWSYCSFCASAQSTQAVILTCWMALQNTLLLRTLPHCRACALRFPDCHS